MSPDSNTPSSSKQPSSGNVEHIKRPANAWILFRSAVIKTFTDQPGVRQATLSGLVSEMWKNAAPSVKAYYKHLGSISVAEHRAKYPDYRFHPVKREDKLRLRAEREAERKAKSKLGREKASRIRRTVRNNPPPPLLTTTPRPAGPPRPVSDVSSSFSQTNAATQPAVPPPMVPFVWVPTLPVVQAPIPPVVQSPAQLQAPTSPTNYSTPTASPSAQRSLKLSPSPPVVQAPVQLQAPIPLTNYSTPTASPSAQGTLKLSPYPYPVPSLVAPQPSSMLPPASTSMWEQQPQQQHVQPQQAECGVSPSALQAQQAPSLDLPEYGLASHQLTVPLPAQPLQEGVEWDHNGFPMSYASMENPSNDPMMYIFGTGDIFNNEQVFDDANGIKVDSSGMDPNSFGFFNSYGSTGSFDGSMTGPSGTNHGMMQGNSQGFSELFNSLIEEDPSSVAGPSQLDVSSANMGETSNMHPAELDQMMASLLQSIESGEMWGSNGASGSGSEAGSTSASAGAAFEAGSTSASAGAAFEAGSMEQAQYVPQLAEQQVQYVAQPTEQQVQNVAQPAEQQTQSYPQPAYTPPAYVPPAGATYASTRRVGADWKHWKVSFGSDTMST